ncbi:MAG: endonuclease/exonuclease/phosphatase family protein [Tepidiformaceae bacterium]
MFWLKNTQAGVRRGQSRVAFVLALTAVVAVMAVACGGGNAGNDIVPTPTVTMTVVPTATALLGTPTPAPTELRVAFIDLLSPVALDNTNSEASDTYDARLALVIQQLQAFKPDIVGFNDVTTTNAHGNEGEALATALKMEAQSIRANPWFPGQTQAQNDAIAKQIGYAEGDMILSRYPILKADSMWINPRTSETEGRAALHVVIKTPGPLGNVDVYITHLTGGGDKIRTAQADAVLSWIAKTRSSGPLLMMGDLGDGPASGAYQAMSESGLRDIAVADAETGDVPANTCCRDRVVGLQPSLTTRTSFVFSGGWASEGATVFDDQPQKQPDGTFLYGSDHDGLEAVFPIKQ